MCVFILEGSEKTEVREMTSLTKVDLLVRTVLPQIAAQLESVETFGEIVDSRDVESIQGAQKTCDRFLKGIHAVAVTEKMDADVKELILLAVGDAFDDSDGEWSWKFPDTFRTPAQLKMTLLALGGLSECVETLKGKKRKAPEREEGEHNDSLNNESLLQSFPGMTPGAEDPSEKVRVMMKDLSMDPASLRDQTQLKDAAAALAAGTTPSALHKTASGAHDLAGLDSLFNPSNGERALAISENGQLVTRTSGNQDNRYLWNLKLNGMIEEMPRNCEARRKAIVYRDSFGLMGQYFPWEIVMSFDTHFRELISTGAPVEISAHSIHSLFLLQQSARSFHSSGDYEPASISKRQRAEKDFTKKVRPDYNSKSKSKGFCTYFQKSNPEGGHKCRKQNCQFPHKCAKCSDSGHGAYACKKKD